MRFLIGICQIKVSSNKQENFTKIKAVIRKLAYSPSKIIILPECWNCPYGIEYFKDYAEDINNSGSIELLKELAIKYKLFIIGGSIPTIQEDKIYNTCVCLDPNGEVIGIYNKIHLFDINLNNFTFKESDVLSSGNKPLIINTMYGKIGIGICYDLRFPLLADYYLKNGCKMIVYPGSFSSKTGPLHWKMLLQSRAVDNQLYIVGCSTAVNHESTYKGYGHSMVINPWGKVLYEVNEEEVSGTSIIDMEVVTEMRLQIPILEQRIIL
jgi:omega-amidase